ncbi:hypothetical protein AB8T91_27310, partial [Klebsiella pneumoniae]
MREQGLRPGDPDWEKWGICDYITKPRVQAAITGKTPNEQPIKGTVAKLAMRQPFVLFKGLTFQKLCLPGAFR